MKNRFLHENSRFDVGDRVEIKNWKKHGFQVPWGWFKGFDPKTNTGIVSRPEKPRRDVDVNHPAVRVPVEDIGTALPAQPTNSERMTFLR